MRLFKTLAGEVNSHGRHVSSLRSRELAIREIANVCRYINTQFHDTAFSGSIIASILGCRMTAVLFLRAWFKVNLGFMCSQKTWTPKNKTLLWTVGGTTALTA
jgi:hypothetical protein